jgi:glycosyltransferase involved in cell wall biosynthesis
MSEKKLKIAVYTIAKNEEQFVKRFMNCIKDEADLVVVADTGSSDDTVRLLKEEGAIVHEIIVNPWRFDVARNISMHLVPADVDICVCIDLDEILSPGWRSEVEKAWTEKTTRLRYQYYWSFNENGTPATSFWYDKIHSRAGYLWKHPVHEVLVPQGIEEVQSFCSTFTLSHYPDVTKSRGSYLPLLELSTKEDPEDDRNSHYLGREYMYYSMHEKAIIELKRHLKLKSATWEAERAASMRFIGRCYEALNETDEATNWFIRATTEAPSDREPWFELGKHYYNINLYVRALEAFKKAFLITQRPASYICDPDAWNYVIYDYAAMCAWATNDKKLAISYIEKCIELVPATKDLSRISQNRKLMISDE